METRVLRLSRKHIENGQHIKELLNVLISSKMVAVIKAHSRNFQVDKPEYTHMPDLNLHWDKDTLVRTLPCLSLHLAVHSYPL